MVSDEQIKKLFFGFEEHKELLAYRLKGVSLYYLLRFPLEMHIRSINLKSRKIKREEIGFVKKVKNKASNIFQKEKNNKKYIRAFSSKEDDPVKAKFLFVSTSGQTSKEGSSLELYDIIKHFHGRGHKINFVQPNYKGKKYPQRSNYYHSFLPLFIDRKGVLPTEEENELKAFLGFISELYEYDFNHLLGSYSRLLYNSFERSSQLEKYLKLLEPEFVFARSIYTASWVALACKRAKVKLIEVQHGVVGEHNIYYQSYLSNKSLTNGDLIMPDFILTLGDEWKKILLNQKSYFNEANTFTLGTTDFTPHSASGENNSKRKMVFMLQGDHFGGIFSINEFIIQFIAKYKERLKELNIEIAIRPHPNDLDIASNFLPKFENHLYIEDPFEIKSIDSILNADWIVSATSMCLYEALAYGKIAVSFTRFKSMNVDNKYIDYVDEVEDLIEIVEGKRSQQAIKFLQPFNPKVLQIFE